MSDTINELKDAPQTFSSWDSCMAKTYCKLPAIIGIIIGVLIAISIIWCCVRCCCCGLSCCCGCFSCFNSCCPSGRGRKRSKYADPPSDYRQPPNPYMGYNPNYGPPAYNGPNTATFDMPGQNRNADSLPAMPTWAEAKVGASNTRGDMEMGHITQPSRASGILPPAAAGRASRGGYRELPRHDDALDQPGGYRGANSTHPYGSDLGAQGMMAQDTAYDPPRPQTQLDQFPRSSPFAPSYNAYASGEQGGPPSLLQVGRRV